MRSNTGNSRGLTRRSLLEVAAATGALAGVEAMLPSQVLDRVLAAPARCGSPADIEHVVIFINENRSFDHYFGTYRGVRGFSDPDVLRLRDGSGLPVFAQPFPGASGAPYGGHLRPFRFDTNAQGECVNDISHEWGNAHQCWNGGALDGFVTAHIADNLPDFYNTMGYYTRADLPFYHALADAFTICDGYHCSVIGPTDPNRLYSMTATLDPAGKNGGPSLKTLTSTRAQTFGTYSWTTYPEQLQAKGISWKVYGTPDGNFGDNVLTYFKNYQSNPQLAANAFAPTFPANFQADCLAGTLPQVSWVLASLTQSEHPPAAVTAGEAVAAQILQALTSNPALWAKTALFITYDENGGFFDHVPPPTAPPGTPDEFVTIPDAQLQTTAGAADSTGKLWRGPIGLGFRVPMLVVSPFSRGGFVCSDTFDHTSLLRFLETRFGPEVPNLSAWRRSVTGDLVSAFNFAAAPNASVPSLPSASQADPRILTSDCPTQAPDTGDESFPTVKPYPLPAPPQAMPVQEPGVALRPLSICVTLGGGGLLGGGLLSGVPSASNPLGLPSASRCVNRRRFAFRIFRPHGHRIVRLDVYVNGRHLRTLRARRGHSVDRITLSSLPAGGFTLRLVAHTAHGGKVTSVRHYHGCKTKKAA